ncbi:hypothetical protein M413DRAFT_20395 [Hebeloma cylindrosporum]|uniref:DUF6699 domain-containing protein n=1 Tax=Hebeloma cylindrosporum TaxID=76867 RepID=A0A0C2Y7Y9_HEBCY|nr:hypothetical protein M413DRAFT_20395 [Hebeloma cylindrosporum h7]
MSRRVHFAPTNTIYEPHSVTPSPALTASSLPSSSSPDLSTPPPDDDDEYEPSIYPRTPYATEIELQPDVVIPKSIQIHFLLAYTPYSEPALPYDLSWPFSQSDMDIPEQVFAEPATSPPLPSLTIIHPALKFDIEVLPSAPFPGSYVSVMDVLTKLYRDLRLAVHPIEYEELVDEDLRKMVDLAYYTRYRAVVRELKGLKKVDLLTGCTRFLGLAGTVHAPDVWELNIS